MPWIRQLAPVYHSCRTSWLVRYVVSGCFRRIASSMMSNNAEFLATSPAKETELRRWVLKATGRPELQSVEQVWPLVDEPVVNRTFVDLNALAATLVTHCRTLRVDRRTVRANTLFSWWSADNHPPTD